MNFEVIDDIPLSNFGKEVPSYPDRVLQYSGLGFGIGTLCGLFLHPIKAINNLPKNGLKGYTKATLINVPRLGCKFALFTGIYTTMECAMDYYFNEEATSHHIIGFAATTALFKSRQGFRVASKSAIGWGSVNALLGEAWIVMERIYIKRKFNKNSIISYGFDDYVPQSEPKNLPDVISIWKLDEQKRVENFGGRMFFGGLPIYLSEEGESGLIHLGAYTCFPLRLLN